MKTFIWFAAIALLPLLVYNIWAVTGKDYSAIPLSDHPQVEISSVGVPSGEGNMIGFRPNFTPADFCNEQHFMHALRAYFEKAKAASLLRSGTIVVLPEYTGTWLAFADEKAVVYTSDSVRLAVSAIINANIFRFITKLLFANADDRVKHALFALKAGSMATIYQQVFAALASEYKVTVVAGSIVLPDPEVDAAGRLRVKPGGPEYNAAFIFGPDGRIIGQAIKKVFLTPAEKTFITPGPLNDLRAAQTPAGNIAVLLSADSRHAEAYEISPGRGILAVPYLDDSVWNASWKLSRLRDENVHYDTTATMLGGQPFSPGNVAITAGIPYCMAVSFGGTLWDMHTPGNAITIRHDSIKIHPSTPQKGQIINMWMDW